MSDVDQVDRENTATRRWHLEAYQKVKGKPVVHTATCVGDAALDRELKQLERRWHRDELGTRVKLL